MSRLVVCGLAVALVVVAAAGAARGRVQVARVVDGDTIVLAGGARVRLVQIDSPEVRSGECYGRAAASELRRLLPGGSAVELETDRRLDSVDRYGRLLRYVRLRGRNVNLELVRRGAATVWFYGGTRGRYARELLAAGRAARAAGRGLWGACRAVWDPEAAAHTEAKGAPALGRGAVGRCHPSYPDFCIPPPPPDLDCRQLGRRRFRVIGADPHRLDRDRDGVGCE